VTFTSATTLVRSAGLDPVLKSIRPLTIKEAKQGLAKKYEVPVEAIDITIRG
jgi:hypothetical protein